MHRKSIWLLFSFMWLAASVPSNGQGLLEKFELTPFVGFETSGSYPLTPTLNTVAVTNARANSAVSFGSFVDYSLTENFQADFMWDRNPTSYSELQPPWIF